MHDFTVYDVIYVNIRDIVDDRFAQIMYYHYLLGDLLLFRLLLISGALHMDRVAKVKGQVAKKKNR